MIWINGVANTLIPSTDRGVLYGDGVWETIAVTQGQPQLLEWHLERLRTGSDALMLNAPSWSQLITEIHQVCEAHPDAVLKIIITRGQGTRGYNPYTDLPSTRILQIFPKPLYPSDYTQAGIRLMQCQMRLAHQPRLAGFKHLNRLEQVLARAEVTTEYQEGLVLDYAGNVIEGTMSNFFMIAANGDIVTPDLYACGISGVIRRFILSVLASKGLSVQIRTVLESELAHARGMWLCNSLIGIWPVREYQSRHYSIPTLVRDLQTQLATIL